MKLSMIAHARLQPTAPMSNARTSCRPAWLTLIEQVKVRTMISPNQISEILSIGSSTRLDVWVATCVVGFTSRFPPTAISIYRSPGHDVHYCYIPTCSAYYALRARVAGGFVSRNALTATSVPAKIRPSPRHSRNPLRSKRSRTGSATRTKQSSILDS